MEKTSTKYLLIVALAIILAVGLLISTRPARQPTLKEILPTHVTVVEVQSRDIQPLDEVTGQFQAARKAVLHFELAGQLVERKVEPGERVEEGQILLRLADGDLQDAVAEARAALQQERAGNIRDRRLLDLATREKELQAKAVERMDRLGREALASKSEREEAQASLLKLQAEEARLRYAMDTAESALQQKESALRRAERNLERARLRAPFKGVINGVFMQLGDYVAPNMPAVELLDTDQLDLYAEITGPTASALRLGQKVKVRVGDQEQPGEIVALQTDPNPATQTHALRIRVAGQGWLPGDLAEVELPLTPLKDAPVAPVSAVLQEEGGSYIFVVREGTLRRIPVTLGPRMQDLQVIASGVRAGDKVVTHDVAALADGERVVVDNG